MSLMIAFGWACIMMLIGMILRAKIGFLKNILMPASVIGGIIGFLLLNVGALPEVDPNMYTQMVNFLFTLSFISIGLTSVPKEQGESGADAAKNVVKGSLGMGFLWAALYGLTPIIGYFVAKFSGAAFGMDGLYGLMIPFAFCQGPGQSATFGTMIEAFGWADATQVAITFAAIGFLFAFLVGVPIAKMGMKKGLAAHADEITEGVAKGIFKKEEQKENCGMITTYNGNIDVLAFHFALVGLCFIGAIYLGKVMSHIPGYFGQTFSSLQFFNGMLCAYAVQWVLKKFNLDQYHDNVLQTRITGLCTDLLVCCAFMAIQVAVVGKWIVPILAVCTVIATITFFFAMYFGPRIGGSCDFERTLGLWGCLTGTCPTGVALIRIVDPHLKTTAATEMGAMNIAMLPSYFVMPAIIGFSSGELSWNGMAIQCLLTFVVLIVLMKVFKVWNKPSFSFSKGISYKQMQTSKGQSAGSETKSA